MRVVFLGTNGWFNTHLANTISTLVQTRDFNLIFDAGDGLSQVKHYIKNKKPVFLFISHLHLDHITGLHFSNILDFKQGLTIVGPKNIKKLISAVFRHPYSADINRLPYKVYFKELKEGAYDFGFKVRALRLMHSSDCLGYRIETGNKAVSYCLDTGYCANAIKLSQGADLLITECSLRAGQDSPRWPHLNARTAAKIACEAGAKKLALTHFNPTIFHTELSRLKAQAQSRKIFKASIAAFDGRTIKI